MTFTSQIFTYSVNLLLIIYYFELPLFVIFSVFNLMLVCFHNSVTMCFTKTKQQQNIKIQT